MKRLVFFLFCYLFSACHHDCPHRTSYVISKSHETHLDSSQESSPSYEEEISAP